MRQVTESVALWSAAHPEWVPSDGSRTTGWQRLVGSTVVSRPTALLLIDPQLPDDGEDARRLDASIMDALDGGREVHVIIANRWHARSADALRERHFDIAVHAPRAARDLGCRATHLFDEETPLPAGARALRVDGLYPGEHAIWLAAERVLVFADALLCGADGRARLAPPEWASKESNHEELRPGLERFLDLDPAWLVTSHSPRAIPSGRIALKRALAAAPWGHEPVEVRR